MFGPKSEPIRTYIYSILVPIAGLLVFYGVLSDTEWLVWVGIVKAVLEIGGGELTRALVTPTVRVRAAVGPTAVRDERL